MATKTKRPVGKPIGKKTIALTKKAKANAAPDVEREDPKWVAIEDIDFSPFNYRKFYSEEDLENFAKELRIHGMISPMTVRTKDDGRYELIVGERRLRAGRIAELKSVLVIIREMTDKQVIEYQLAENIQRENPHPMHEAQAIGQLQSQAMTVNQVAARLGKSRAFVFGRIKLLSLIPDFQELFVANRISLQTALEIAVLSPESQQEFFNEQCNGWKQNKNFLLSNLSYYLRHYRCDLKRAPFDPADKELVRDAGACTNCPFNSALLKSLFPEMAKESICTNRECYRNKSNTHYSRQLVSAFAEHQPAALLFDGTPSPLLVEAVESIPEAAALPTYDRYDVSVVSEPAMPDKEDFFTEDEDTGELQPDEYEYEAALQDYASDLEEFQQFMSSGNAIKGLYLTRSGAQIVYFTVGRSGNNKGSVTAKQVQEALKNGTATVELLEAEITRIREREKRSQELDRQKVQKTVHSSFLEQVTGSIDPGTPTSDDLVGARFIIYEALDYSARGKVDAVLFPESAHSYSAKQSQIIDRLSTMTDQEYSFLIRMAVLGKADSKSADSKTGKILYSMAVSWGLDVQNIENSHAEKVEQRQSRQELRIIDLEKKIARLKTIPEQINQAA